VAVNGGLCGEMNNTPRGAWLVVMIPVGVQLSQTLGTKASKLLIEPL